jgi:hypothetical protein
MFARKSNVFLLFMAVNIFLLALVFSHASYGEKNTLPYLREKAQMVKRIGLSDLCLFTDARYARHPSMADLSTPFQDHPMSLEHFPSGTIITPPPHLLSK